MGAGVATLLGILLRERYGHLHEEQEQEPERERERERERDGMAMQSRQAKGSMHVYAYGPPGGLLTIVAARKCCEFVTSFVFGEEFCPRLSVASLYTLLKRPVHAVLPLHPWSLRKIVANH